MDALDLFGHFTDETQMARTKEYVPLWGAPPPCNLTWRGINNLRGNPPVRSESPPNKAVVEDQAVYGRTHGAALKVQAQQLQRAAQFSDKKGIDSRYWFAKTYSYVTKHMLDFTQNTQFFYPTYVMWSILYFDKLYDDNMNAFSKSFGGEAHWQRVFIENLIINKEMTLVDEAWLDPTGLSTLLLASRAMAESMKAHIRFDLPRAEAWVYQSYYDDMKARPDWQACDPSIHDCKLDDFQADFAGMFGVFDKAQQEMQHQLSEKISWLASLASSGNMDWAMRNIFDADMRHERADAWARAQQLSKTAPSTGPYKPGKDGLLVGDATQGNHVSALANILDKDLRPSMDHAAAGYDDDVVRAQTDRNSLTSLQKLNTSNRIRMIQGLLSSHVGEASETSLKKLLLASFMAGDLVTVVDSVGCIQILDECDGEDYDQVRALLGLFYYKFVNFETAQAILVRVIVPCAAEWKQELIADILSTRSDGRRLIIGYVRQLTPGLSDEEAYADGRRLLMVALDGAEQTKVAERFPKH